MRTSRSQLDIPRRRSSMTPTGTGWISSSSAIAAARRSPTAARLSLEAGRAVRRPTGHGGALSRRTATSAATGKPQVRLGEAIDQHAHERLVESDLASVGRGAQGVGLDLHDGDLAHRRDRCRAAPRPAGEIENLAEAAPGLDGVELLAQESHAHFAGYQEVETVALVGLPDDDGSRVHGLPAADPHDLPQGDVVEVLEKRHIAQIVELLGIGNRRTGK